MDREPRNKDIVTLEDLPRWELVGQEDEEIIKSASENPLYSKPSKFPVNKTINAQITLWMGDLRTLDVDAVVNTTNESMTDTSGISGSLLEAGGPELKEEIARNEHCKTGEARLTKGYNIAARFIIHTVGPRYNDKYVTAAENALHSCYRSCLALLKEQNLRTIAFPVINSQKRGYPPEGGAHIAIRTVRRFLENWGKDIDLIILCVNNTQDLKLYSRILPLYFPRNIAEELVAKEELPRDTGNEYGETVIEERKIRISAFPSTASPTGAPITSTTTTATTATTLPATNYSAFKNATFSEKSLYIAPEKFDYESPLESKLPDKSFATMKGDLDEMRKKKLQKVSRDDHHKQAQQQMYQNFLYKAQQMDLSDVARLNVIYESGKDLHGRPIVVIVGYRLPNIRSHLDRVFLYLISIMDRIADSPYCVVYLHTFMEDKTGPEFGWIKQIYELIDAKYGTQLASFYVVHPTFWLKVFEGVVSTFVVNASFWTKLKYLDNLEEIYNGINREQLHIPEEIINFNNQLNGKRPHTPAKTVASANDFTDDL